MPTNEHQGQRGQRSDSFSAPAPPAAPAAHSPYPRPWPLGLLRLVLATGGWGGLVGLFFSAYDNVTREGWEGLTHPMSRVPQPLWITILELVLVVALTAGAVWTMRDWKAESDAISADTRARYNALRDRLNALRERGQRGGEDR